ncbi:proteinral negative regulator of transcription subunit 5 [Rhodotorula toruloides]
MGSEDGVQELTVENGRNLRAEIDKTLKKVSEGVEVFEGIFDKIQASSNQTQKEKLEQDLKTQIKKLQRLRDQIKTWMTSNDIKDKQPLIDNRKLIETQMEKFKACEKEMKTKAFSKEGLSAATKLDPKEQQKVDMCQWIQNMVEELSRQVEQSEAEVEQIQGTKQKKKDSEREQRLEELERLNERRDWHINRLELILRLLENGNLSVDAVTNVKEDIAYFVETNTEEDFEEDEGIYDELNLEDEEDLFQIGQDDHQSSHDSQSVADEPAPPVPLMPKTPAKAEKKQDEPVPEKTPAKAKPAVATPQKNASLDATTSRPSAAPAQTPSRSVSGPAASTPQPRSTPAPPLPPIRYAAAAAAANASSQPPAASAASASAPSPALAAPTPPPATTTASSPGAPAGPPPGLSAPASSAAPTISAANEEPAKEAASASSTAPSPALAAPAAPSPPPRSGPAAPVSQPPQTADSASPAPSSSDVQQQSQHSKQDARLPSSLADLVTSFESAKQKSLRRDQDLGAINQVLEAGFSNIPQPLDAEKPKYYVPRTPYATPTYYPQEPSSQFASPAFFSKLDVDTLFYIFYFASGTYMQYLAAKELEKSSWRYHRQYLTWFQRCSAPTTITDTYEVGVYLYFDWEGTSLSSWCQRRKTNFRFEYKHLEVE